MTRPRTPVAAVAGALAALLALLVLAGCGTGSSDDAMGGESMAEPMMDDATMRGLAEEVAGGAMDSTSASMGDGDMSVDAADVAESATEEGAEGAREAAIISTGTVSLRADDVGDARFEVQKVVDRVGGQVTDSETRTDDDGEVRTARLVLRVPSAEFTETIDALEKVADLEASSTTSEDVTSQVVDTDVRIRVQRQSIARIEQLLDRAGSIRDIVAVERQLTDREARLNSLLRQQAYLADQTSMSTITVHLQRHPSEEPEEEDGDDGFLAGLSAGWEALGTVAVGLATVAGAVLPFAVLALVLGLPGWLLLRGAVRRRRTPGSVAAQPAAPAEG
ncbi:DUF4349 domain-containing protein [Nocardioides marinus]|uniref:DUF4349 domain-containing protein n=1 Tax=Nocardioides marinus TaxID=374514 RepID=A0A7Y9YDN1_9ACTN|nr:DUF4349 domain-containing protein [Nocardioides marinus]MBU2075803.1 DUF4349 domain-containing protein [Actinomycetota bacterium]NYI09047.1 hypothetical protein [Nocardioides marinus]